MANDHPPIGPDRVGRAIEKLPADEREALILSASGQLSTVEIAGRLGIALDEVEPLIANALLLLERALRRQERPWWRFW